MNPRNFFTRPALMAFVFALLTPAAHAWWKPEWTQRTRVDIDTSAQGLPTQAAVSGFALAVRLHSGNFDFAAARENGADLRVVAGDDKTPLRFHVERYDNINELGVLWVQLPSLLPGQAKTTVFVYAGNSKAELEPAAGPDATDTTSGTVFHLDKAEAAALGGTPRAAAPITLLDNALLGTGARLAQQPITWPASDKLKVAAGAALTWSLWVKPDAAAGTLLQQGPLTLALREGKVEARSAGKTVVGGDVPPAAWAHVALVLAQGQATLWVNGVAGTPAPLAVAEVAGDLLAGNGLAGVIDEIVIAATARSADWLKLAADTQGAGSKALKSIKEDSAAASGEGGHGGYFGVLFANLTTDAWIIIIILAVMFIIALWVMVTKALMIARIGRANTAFLAQFKAAGANLLAVPDSTEVQQSSLYRVYRSGVRELADREVAAGHEPGRHAPLSGASISAVRAAVDADLVRETHKLNSGIVLLTIAISGGPFLGLLGTVVGVMITFAAIAAAGDVNVNAIAPGIAAALLATVAGLGVAIPSLFGYNYLAAQIKNLTSDMQIFVDEFVARAAERYGQP
jgi:biopolymer transport protein ExbB